MSSACLEMILGAQMGGGYISARETCGLRAGRGPQKETIDVGWIARHSGHASPGHRGRHGAEWRQRSRPCQNGARGPRPPADTDPASGRGKMQAPDCIFRCRAGNRFSFFRKICGWGWRRGRLFLWTGGLGDGLFLTCACAGLNLLETQKPPGWGGFWVVTGFDADLFGDSSSETREANTGI